MADATEDTFTFGEMREARNKAARGEPLTEKEKELADARRKAEGWIGVPSAQNLLRMRDELAGDDYGRCD